MKSNKYSFYDWGVATIQTSTLVKDSKVRKIKWSSSNLNLLSNKMTILRKLRKWLWNVTDVSNSSCGPEGFLSKRIWSNLKMTLSILLFNESRKVTRSQNCRISWHHVTSYLMKHYLTVQTPHTNSVLFLSNKNIGIILFSHLIFTASSFI